MPMKNNYDEQELKIRKRLVKFLRGTHQRFIKGTNFEKNCRDFIDYFFIALNFDEDEQIMDLMMNSYVELRQLLSPLRSNHEDINKFLKIVDSLYSTEYTAIIDRYYR